MPLLLTIRNRQHARSVDLRLLRRIVNRLLTDLLHVENAELGIYLNGASEMTRLNETFVHHAGSTDVITFDYATVGQASSLSPFLPDVGAIASRDRQDACPTLHAEIFVCVDEAVVQARRFRTSWQSELVRYVIHGLLHLGGFDDQTVARRRKMKREENRLLRELGRHFRLAKLARPNQRRGKS